LTAVSFWNHKFRVPYLNPHRFAFVSKLVALTWLAFEILTAPSSKLSFNKLITTAYAHLLGASEGTVTATKTWFVIVNGRIVYFEKNHAFAISSDFRR
jgi:hypothetical protein